MAAANLRVMMDSWHSSANNPKPRNIGELIGLSASNLGVVKGCGKVFRCSFVSGTEITASKVSFSKCPRLGSSSCVCYDTGSSMQNCSRWTVIHKVQTYLCRLHVYSCKVQSGPKVEIELEPQYPLLQLTEWSYACLHTWGKYAMIWYFWSIEIILTQSLLSKFVRFVYYWSILNTVWIIWSRSLDISRKIAQAWIFPSIHQLILNSHIVSKVLKTKMIHSDICIAYVPLN